MAQLISLSETSSAKIVPLHGERVSIGRSSDNVLALNDKAVSRHHAELVHEGGKWKMRDLESRNGILVNLTRVKEAQLADGDMITIGETTLRFKDEPTGGLGSLAWASVIQLQITWPIRVGPGIHDAPLASETLVHRPIRMPLLPNQSVLDSLDKADVVRRALVHQELQAALLAAKDAGVLWADVLSLVLKHTGQPWAGALLPQGEGKPLRLQLQGTGGQDAEVPLIVLEASARAGEALHWMTLQENSREPLNSVFALPWVSEKGSGGLLFGPITRHPAQEMAPLLDLLAGVALEVGHWYEVVTARWAGKSNTAPRPAMRPVPRHAPAL